METYLLKYCNDAYNGSYLSLIRRWIQVRKNYALNNDIRDKLLVHSMSILHAIVDINTIYKYDDYKDRE